MIFMLKNLVLVSQCIIVFLSYRVSFLPTTLRKIHRSSIGAFPLKICPSGFLDFIFEIVPLHHSRVIDDPDVPPIKSGNEFQSQIWDPGISTLGIEDNKIRLPILAGEKKSNFDYPQSESLVNGGVGEAAGTSRDLSRGEAIVNRSLSQDLGHVTRRSGGSVATGTNTTVTQRRTRKVAIPKSEKARWKRVVRMFAKQIGAFFILVGLIQLTRTMLLKASSPSSPISSFGTEMAFGGLESRIAKEDGLVKAATNTMPFQVDLIDKTMEREAKAVRQTIRLWLDLLVFVALQPLYCYYAHTKEIQVQIVNLNYLFCLWYKHQPRHEPLGAYGWFLTTYLNSSAGSAICQSLCRRRRLWAVKEKMMHFFYYYWIWYFLLICIVRHFFCYGNLAGISKYFGYRRHDPEPFQATYRSIRLIRVMRKAFRSFIYKMIAFYKYMRRGLNRFYLLPVRLLLESRVTSTSSSKLGFNFLYLFQWMYLNGFLYHVSCNLFMK